MIRKIIQIDEEKCNGCGLCAQACHEGAIKIVDGKARLLRDDYCDGLGDCLPACPENAISFVEREAKAYDQAAVLKSKKEKNLKIITSHELLEMLPFGKTKFNQLLKAGELPLMKIGNDYITTESAVEKWITDNIGQELFY